MWPNPELNQDQNRAYRSDLALSGESVDFTLWSVRECTRAVSGDGF